MELNKLSPLPLSQRHVRKQVLPSNHAHHLATCRIQHRQSPQVVVPEQRQAPAQRVVSERHVRVLLDVRPQVNQLLWVVVHDLRKGLIHSRFGVIEVTAEPHPVHHFVLLTSRESPFRLIVHRRERLVGLLLFIGLRQKHFFDGAQ